MLSHLHHGSCHDISKQLPYPLTINLFFGLSKITSSFSISSALCILTHKQFLQSMLLQWGNSPRNCQDLFTAIEMQSPMPVKFLQFSTPKWLAHQNVAQYLQEEVDVILKLQGIVKQPTWNCSIWAQSKDTPRFLRITKIRVLIIHFLSIIFVSCHINEETYSGTFRFFLHSWPEEPNKPKHSRLFNTSCPYFIVLIIFLRKQHNSKENEKKFILTF